MACWGSNDPGAVRGPRSHDGTIITERVDTMWGTDFTTVMTGEGQAAVFVAIDHCSAECVGVHAARQATRFEALEPIRQGVRQHFGAFGRQIAAGLTVRHDHGSQYLANDFQKELAFLGIASSPAFVRAPEGNGCAERFIRTLKENLLWLRSFERSSSCAKPCSGSRNVTIGPGSSNASATGHRPKCVPRSFHPRPWPHRLQLGVSHPCSGTGGRPVGRQGVPRTEAAGVQVRNSRPRIE